MDRKADGTFTSNGAKKFGFKNGNDWGKLTGGKNHYKWNGGVKLYPSGKTTYRAIKFGEKYVLEHRYLMEKKIGRKLLPTEAIHHKDKNGLNNSLDNLEIVSWAEHKRKHLGSYKHKNFECNCGKKKHFAKGMCSRCYGREYARKKFSYKRRYVNV